MNYIPVQCPHCGLEQQVANKCTVCGKFIIMTLNETVQCQIQKAYNLTGHNARAAADLLGVPYRTFWRRLGEFKASREWGTKAMGHLYKPMPRRTSVKASASR